MDILSTIAECKSCEAMVQGELDNLAVKGKPLAMKVPESVTAACTLVLQVGGTVLVVWQ